MSESIKNQDNLSEITNTMSTGGNRKMVLGILVVIMLIVIGGSFFMGRKDKAKIVDVQPETKQPRKAFNLPPPVEQEPEVVIIDNTRTIEDEAKEEILPPPKVDRVNKSRSSTNAIVINNNSSGRTGNDLDYARNSDEAELKVAQKRGDLNVRNKAIIARKISINPNFLLPKGAIIHCSLTTKIVSDLGGNIGCVVSQDVYSSNGNVRLIEKGSKVFGVYQSGSTALVGNRLFAMWEEIKTPNNISIEISSGSVDSLGGSGMIGWVDNHFWKNFGNAILLSVFDDGMEILKDRIDRMKGDNNTSVDASQSTLKKLPEMILERTVNIPPTLYKNQGDQVAIFVAEDVDFSQVYKLIYKKGME